jgi:c-di-GMP-binding flagellar brake protein YcgR
MEQPAEVLDGERLLGTLERAIEARRVCRMEFPQTKYAWITIILAIESVGDSQYLLIDKVRDFQTALAQSSTREIMIDFMEADGVPCHFTTKVFDPRSDALWVELPKSIVRMQKRRFYRVKARLGTELIFRTGTEREVKAIVRDYSMGGVAFFKEAHLDLQPDDQVSQVELRVPQGSQSISFTSQLAVVKRFERQPRGKEICVLEFVEMSDTTKESLWRHIFEEQRMLLKKTKAI